jgi:hypothetical protein
MEYGEQHAPSGLSSFAAALPDFAGDGAPRGARRDDLVLKKLQTEVESVERALRDYIDRQNRLGVTIINEQAGRRFSQDMIGAVPDGLCQPFLVKVRFVRVRACVWLFCAASNPHSRCYPPGSLYPSVSESRSNRNWGYYFDYKIVSGSCRSRISAKGQGKNSRSFRPVQAGELRFHFPRRSFTCSARAEI